MEKLNKAENPNAYKKEAERGIMVGFPVSISGQNKRPDNGIGYHSTVKFFDPDKDHVHEVHNIAQNLKLSPPNPKTTQIEPGMFKDRMGNDVYVIKLHGNDAQKIKEHNARFSHMGYPQNFEYAPHVSVDKATHDRIKASGAKTAHEAGIEFGNAELKQGHNTLATYRHKMDDNTPVEQHEPIVPIQTDKDTKKFVASENTEQEVTMEKASIRNAVAGAAMLGASLAHSSSASAPIKNPDAYDHGKMLRAIASVESSGGKNTNHEPLKNGTHAYGKYGLTPELVKETIRMSPDLKSRHAKALALEGDTVNKYLQDNPGLEDKIADRHLSRLEHHFGGDPSAIGYSWLNGIRGTNKAKNEKHDIGSHWHVKKIHDAYLKDGK